MATYNYITSNGLIVADTESVKTEVENEYKQIFGDDFVVDPETPQGVLIASEVTARQSVARNNAALANQINPNYAGGVFLDAIWALTGGQRLAATPSTVTATLSGVAGTVVPAGSQAETTAGDIFELAAGVTIGGGGTIPGVFQSVENGPIPIGSATLTVIRSGVLGWETVTNATAGTPGRSTESDAASRVRRRSLIGIQARTVPQAIIGTVSAVDGVKSMAFLENTAATGATIQGIVMTAKSIWCCVDGGTNNDVALAILRSRSAGVDMVGGTTVSVIDPASGQTYSVDFDRPTPVPMLVRVSVRANSSVANPTQAVQEAVLAYAAGELEGEQGFVVGSDVSPFEIGAAVGRYTPALFVTLVEVAPVSTGTYQTTVFDIDINELATITAGNIVVQIV